MMQTRSTIAALLVLLFAAPGAGIAAVTGPAYRHAPAPVSALASLNRISFAPQSDGEGTVVRFHMDAPVQAFREPVQNADNEVELLIFNARLGDGYGVGSVIAPVQAVRVEQQNNHLKVTITLDGALRFSSTAYRDRQGSDLLLAVDPQGRRHMASTASSNSRWNLDTIVIDAGHGGRDNGASAHGVREKDVALAVARKLGRQIEEQLGLRVIYTREDDRFIGLNQRGKIANDAGGKLFISIHANAAPSAQAAGTETFFLGMHKSSAARDVMDRENSVVQLESDPDQYSDMTDEALIMQTLAHSAYMRKSEELASVVEDAMDQHAGRKSRGVKQAGFYVLWSASMPSILVELGFLTNPREAAFLSSNTGQEYLAEAIFRAVEAYRDKYERDLHLMGP